MKLASYRKRLWNENKSTRISNKYGSNTAQQLADLVHVSNRTIISIEKEQYSPSLMLAYRMAQVFGTTIEELCCLKENKEMEDKKHESKE